MLRSFSYKRRIDNAGGRAVDAIFFRKQAQDPLVMHTEAHVTKEAFYLALTRYYYYQSLALVKSDSFSKIGALEKS